MLPKPGATLIKIQSDPSVYEVEADGATGEFVLRHVASEAVASARYGQRWADYVIDVEPTLMSHYTRGASQTSTQSADRTGMKTRAEISTLSQR
jgi:hypothetical protein